MAINTGKNEKLVKDRFSLGNLPITADHIKAKVLHYFRYDRAFVSMCCTEFEDPYTGVREDIVCREYRKVGGDKDNAPREVLYHAIEVKISESDFKREFWHKKEKHVDRGDGRFYDYFYFAVPSELVSFVAGYLEQEMLPYGIFGVGYNDKGELKCELIQRASPLERLDDPGLIERVDAALCTRMSSEVAKTNADIYKLKDGLSEVRRQLDFLSRGIKLS